MEYRKFGPEQRREVLENTLAGLESQHYARSLDIEKWRKILSDPLNEAAEADTRIRNNRDSEAKQQLAAALYDLRKLEIAIEQTVAELDALGKG
ncbi:MAG: hypothetical protein KatS3mg064_0586 [Tepidiforma sp.]|nr:hypothetical protein [Tepidiforma sp.]GIW17429.1 MAG: hypothetical protein KatS3mg064_0586 [Tepidiforma sp.]